METAFITAAWIGPYTGDTVDIPVGLEIILINLSGTTKYLRQGIGEDSELRIRK